MKHWEEAAGTNRRAYTYLRFIVIMQIWMTQQFDQLTNLITGEPTTNNPLIKLIPWVGSMALDTVISPPKALNSSIKLSSDAHQWKY